MNDIVQKATHKSPKERYKSCDDFKKELLQLKNHINRPETEFIYNLSVKIVNENGSWRYYFEGANIDPKLLVNKGSICIVVGKSVIPPVIHHSFYLLFPDFI